MKRVFFLLPVLFFINASAQIPHYNFKKFNEKNESLFLLPKENSKPTNSMSKDSLAKVMKALQEKQYLSGLGQLAFTHPNGDKIYSLPQDNMLCLVPDLARTNYNMPNPVKGMRVTGMPPGSVPQRKIIIPPNENKKPLP